MTEQGDRLFLNDKLLVPEKLIQRLIDYWHNIHLMHPGLDKMQRDAEWRFEFPSGYYAILNLPKSPKHSTAGMPLYTAILEAQMGSIAMDVFAMPGVTAEGANYDCIVSTVDRHSSYIVAIPGKKFKKGDMKDKHGVGLQANTVTQAMIWHWLTIFDVPAVICSHRRSQFVCSLFRSMCKHMEMRHAKTVAYHRRSDGRVDVTRRQMFEKFRQLHIEEPGSNWLHSLWRVLQAFHDLLGPTGMSPDCISFLRDRVSRTVPWMNHGTVARYADTMRSKAGATGAKVCKSLHDEHERGAKYL